MYRLYGDTYEYCNAQVAQRKEGDRSRVDGQAINKTLGSSGSDNTHKPENVYVHLKHPTNVGRHSGDAATRSPPPALFDCNVYTARFTSIQNPSDETFTHA